MRPARRTPARWWITGASQGLGEELALHLASLGARLILSSRREATLKSVCDAAAAGAADARPLILDARAGSDASAARAPRRSSPPRT